MIKDQNDTTKIRNKLSKLNEGSKKLLGCGLTGIEIIGNLIDYNKFNIYAVDGLSLPLNTFNKNISNILLIYGKK